MSEQYSEEDFQADVKSTLNNQAENDNNDNDDDLELEHTEMKIPSKNNYLNHGYSDASAYIRAEAGQSE